jgi:hypothetical protein
VRLELELENLPLVIPFRTMKGLSVADKPQAPRRVYQLVRKNRLRAQIVPDNVSLDMLDNLTRKIFNMMRPPQENVQQINNITYGKG